jgi:hypothetical protein
METIDISVSLKFTIREIPLSISEVFLVIQQAMKKLGRSLAVVFLQRLEQQAETALKQQGYVRHSYQKRDVCGVLGTISLRLLRMKGADNKVRYALREVVEIPSYKRYTLDAFEAGFGLIPHLSYKRSGAECKRIQGSSPGKSTLHRRLKGYAAQVEVHPDQKAKGYRYVVVDGTGARFQRCSGSTRRRVETYGGEVRMVHASQGVGKPFEVIGRWTNTSWAAIAEQVYERIDPADVQVLISDGEPGIEEAFLHTHMKHQRCSVHVWKDLRQFLYQDGVKKAGQTEIYGLLHTVPVFTYANKQKLETLKSKDSAEVQQHITTSQKQLLELQQVLKDKGYHKTATYIANLSEPLLTFLTRWVDTGEAAPATSNIAENRFSLIKNRIARIGRRWSEAGLQRFIDIAIHKLFPGYKWNKLWEKLLPLTGNLTCEIVAIQ